MEDGNDRFLNSNEAPNKISSCLGDEREERLTDLSLASTRQIKVNMIKGPQIDKTKRHKLCPTKDSSVRKRLVIKKHKPLSTLR